MKATKLIPLAARTITSVAALIKRLEQVQRDGFALCHEETFDEDISIGALVFGPSGDVIAGVATTVLATRWSIHEAREQFGLDSEACEGGLKFFSGLARAVWIN